MEETILIWGEYGDYTNSIVISCSLFNLSLGVILTFDYTCFLKNSLIKSKWKSWMVPLLLTNSDDQNDQDYGKKQK